MNYLLIFGAAIALAITFYFIILLIGFSGVSLNRKAQGIDDN